MVLKTVLFSLSATPQDPVIRVTISEPLGSSSFSSEGQIELIREHRDKKRSLVP